MNTQVEYKNFNFFIIKDDVYLTVLEIVDGCKKENHNNELILKEFNALNIKHIESIELPNIKKRTSAINTNNIKNLCCEYLDFNKIPEFIDIGLIIDKTFTGKKSKQLISDKIFSSDYTKIPFFKLVTNSINEIGFYTVINNKLVTRRYLPSEDQNMGYKMRNKILSENDNLFFKKLIIENDYSGIGQKLKYYLKNIDFDELDNNLNIILKKEKDINTILDILNKEYLSVYSKKIILQRIEIQIIEEPRERIEYQEDKVKDFMNLFFNNLDETQTVILQKILEDKIILNERIKEIHKQYEENFVGLKNMTMQLLNNNKKGSELICQKN